MAKEKYSKAFPWAGNRTKRRDPVSRDWHWHTHTHNVQPVFRLMTFRRVRLRIEIMIAHRRRVGRDGRASTCRPPARRPRPDVVRSLTGCWPPSIAVVPHRQTPPSPPTVVRLLLPAFLSSLIYYSAGDGGKCNLLKSGAGRDRTRPAGRPSPKPMVSHPSSPRRLLLLLLLPLPLLLRQIVDERR